MPGSIRDKMPLVLTLLKRLDIARLTPRDAVVLYYIIRNPGANRNEIAHALGLHAEVNVLLPVKRLTKAGLIEDRREKPARMVASLLHVTDKGLEVWQEVVK